MTGLPSNGDRQATTGRAGTAVATAIALAVLLLVDLIAVVVLPRPITLHGPGALADVIPELQHFVEHARGLRFHHNVDIRLSNDLGALNTGLSEGTGAGAADAAASQSAVLRALGMVDERYNEKAAAQSLNSQVLGVYQPRTHRLMVRPGPITARLRITLVHELTHALDGEHHQLVRKTKSIRPDESGTSFRALAEGDAMWVESRYRATLSAADQAGATAADGPAPTGIPDALLLLAAYPYAAGRAFIEELVKQDGTDAVDRAFDHPPITSEQILHVDRYLGHDRPRVVVKPVPEGRVVQRGVFGELLLRLMLSRSLGADPARRAGTGWGGGRYVAWRSGTSVCVRGTLVMDTAADTDELVAALRQWATSRPRARVTPSPGRSVMFDNCVDA